MSRNLILILLAVTVTEYSSADQAPFVVECLIKTEKLKFNKTLELSPVRGQAGEWGVETRLPNSTSARLVVRLHNQMREQKFEFSVKNDNKMVGQSNTAILWRDEDASTGLPTVEEPQAIAQGNFVTRSGAPLVIACSMLAANAY